MQGRIARYSAEAAAATGARPPGGAARGLGSGCCRAASNCHEKHLAGQGGRCS